MPLARGVQYEKLSKKPLSPLPSLRAGCDLRLDAPLDEQKAES